VVFNFVTVCAACPANFLHRRLKEEMRKGPAPLEMDDSLETDGLHHLGLLSPFIAQI